MNGKPVSSLPAFVGFPTKRAGIGCPYKLKDNMEQDIANLQAFYAPFTGKVPQQQPTLVTNLKPDINWEQEQL